MGPHPEVPVDVQKYIGPCLITQQPRSKRKTSCQHQSEGVSGVYGGNANALSPPCGSCRRAVDVGGIGCCYPNFNKNYAWTGLPLISIASSRQKNRGTSRVRLSNTGIGRSGERERKDSSGSECVGNSSNLEDILSISRLAIHAQGAPLIISPSSGGDAEKSDGCNSRCSDCRSDACLNRRHQRGGGGIYWSCSPGSSSSGSCCSSPMSIVVPNSCYSPDDESNIYGDLSRQTSPLPSDSVSTTSEDSITSENGLPRIIKPRKRRKKDRRSNLGFCETTALDVVGGKAIVTLKPYQPLCYGFTEAINNKVPQQSDKTSDSGRNCANKKTMTTSSYPYPSSPLCRCPYCVPPPPTVITPPDSPIGGGSQQEKWYSLDHQHHRRPSSCEISTKIVNVPGGSRDLEIKFLPLIDDDYDTNTIGCSAAEKGTLVLTSTHPPQRPWVQLTEPSMSSSCTFTVMCYNILCDKYATRQMYGYCPNWALEWNYRKKNIMHEIRHYKADVISLQEVETEQFYHFFLPELKKDGYDGIFSPKSRAKTMSENERKHVDGCAIFFKTNKFFLIKEYLVEFNQLAMANAEGSDDMLNRVMTKDNIGLAALLQTRIGAYDNSVDPSKANQTILVCTAHIHWDPEYSDVKLIQTMMLMHELQLIVEDTLEKCTNPNVLKEDLNTIPILLCGDFNSLPNSGVVEFLSTGHISTNHCDFKQFVYEDCLRKLGTSLKANEFTHPFKISRAYSNDIMPFTNYSYDFKGIIDYVFYSELHMAVLGVLGPVDSTWLHDNRVQGCPHPHVPSDHFPILVELELAPTLPIHPPPPNGITLHR